MTTFREEPLTEEEVNAALDKHGPSYAAKFTDEAVREAIGLIYQHADALCTLGMKRAADDLFRAIAHLRPVPRAVSRAYCMDLNEKVRMQRSNMSGLLAMTLGQSEDPVMREVAMGIANKIAENNGGVKDYAPLPGERT